MIRETETTRARRRDAHCTYAPFGVRPALRGDRPDPFWKAAGIGVSGFVLLTGVFVVASIVMHLWPSQ